MEPLLFIFCDGVGLCPPGSDQDPWQLARVPAWERTLGRRPRADLVVQSPGLTFRPLDATLEVPRLPQSGTGLVSLLTGHNAAAWIGKHQAGVPQGGLAELLARDAWARATAEAGGRVTVLNAYTPGYFSRAGRGHSAITQAGEAAGVRFRMLDDLRLGNAVPFDLSGAAFRAHGWDGPLTDPHTCGARASAIAGQWDLTLFEFVLSDWAGHRANPAHAVEILEMLDTFLGGVLEHRPPSLAVVLTSDHGNLEATWSQLHTRNPVPLLWVGPGAEAACQASSLLDVPCLLRRHFSLPPPQPLPAPPIALPRRPRRAEPP